MTPDDGSAVTAMRTSTHIDVLPTAFDLLGLPIPANVQGKSFAAHARGERTDERNEAVFSHMVETQRSIRTNTHKLIRNFRPPRWPMEKAPVDFAASRNGAGNIRSEQADAGTLSDTPHLELYDLVNDPHEFTNVAGTAAYANVQAELDARLWGFSDRAR
jgi:N-sulfoglucosamine sulfohydrolase